jgi:hypothetical protein
LLGSMINNAAVILDVIEVPDSSKHDSHNRYRARLAMRTQKCRSV